MDGKHLEQEKLSHEKGIKINQGEPDLPPGPIWMYTIYNLYKYNLQFLQMHLSIWTNAICNLEKYELQFGQI